MSSSSKALGARRCVHAHVVIIIIYYERARQCTGRATRPPPPTPGGREKGVARRRLDTSAVAAPSPGLGSSVVPADGTLRGMTKGGGGIAYNILFIRVPILHPYTARDNGLHKKHLFLFNLFVFSSVVDFSSTKSSHTCLLATLNLKKKN